MFNKGVCVVATGHPFYGRMCFNLAKTIKAIDRACPVQVITDGSALAHINIKDLWVFDEITRMDAGANGFRLKLHIDELSIFDEFILMDADCAWVNPQSPVQLINALGTQCNFTAITEGKYDIETDDSADVNKAYYFWADVKELVEKYNLRGTIYQWRTEFMYVKKCDTTREMFGSARYIYDNAQKDIASLKLFAGNVPDELGLNVAACICNMVPHQYKWQPTFWHRLYNDNAPQLEALCAQYYALSCGSNVTSMNVKKLYDRIVKSASYKLGLQHIFPMISKREMMPSRQQM